MSKFEKFAVAERLLSTEETKQIKGGEQVGWTCTCNNGSTSFSTPGTSMNLAVIFEVCGPGGAGCNPVFI